MSHEIETIAYSGGVPWHKIGREMPAGTSVDDFLVASGLDWTVDPMPMFTRLPDGSMIEVPGRSAMVRSKDNKVMTVTSEHWKPLQNRDALNFMKDYVEAGGATMETAGSLRGGQVIWGLARLNHSFEVTPGDKVNGYLLITSPHVVGKSISIRTTTVRVVCANTMAMAERGGGINYKQNHLSVFNVDAAKAAVEATHEELRLCEKRAHRLQKLKIKDKDLVEKVLIPVYENDLVGEKVDMDDLTWKLKEILSSVHEAPGALPGTGWGALNGVTHWSDHVQGRGAETRMYKSWMGVIGRQKLEVQTRLLDLAA